MPRECDNCFDPLFDSELVGDELWCGNCMAKKRACDEAAANIDAAYLTTTLFEISKPRAG